MVSWEFDEFRLFERELLRNGQRVPLGPRPLKVLLYLVQERPRVVSKNELVDIAWDGDAVTDQAVDKTVSRAREALGDTTPQRRFIETVRGQGYAFIGAVVEKGPRAPQRRASAYVPGDRSRFVRDVNMPDGGVLKIREQVTKQWEIRNVGTVPWVGRFLERQGPADAPGRLRSPERVRIPDTLPGQTCIVAVDLTAPDTPGSCYAEWKMVDEQGRFCLPRQTPVYVSVDVRD